MKREETIGQDRKEMNKKTENDGYDDNYNEICANMPTDHSLLYAHHAH